MEGRTPAVYLPDGVDWILSWRENPGLGTDDHFSTYGMADIRLFGNWPHLLFLHRGRNKGSLIQTSYGLVKNVFLGRIFFILYLKAEKIWRLSYSSEIRSLRLLVLILVSLLILAKHLISFSFTCRSNKIGFSDPCFCPGPFYQGGDEDGGGCTWRRQASTPVVLKAAIMVSWVLLKLFLVR